MKICIILVYINEFPKFFNTFLQSCYTNKNVDFLIFNDKKTHMSKKNVKIEYIDLEIFNQLIAKKIPNLKCELSSTFKIADFRPAFGLIFEDYLKEYDFWGFCDCDLIFGNIRKLYTDNLLNQYDLLGNRGHFELYRNNERMRYLFQAPSSGIDWKTAFSCKEIIQFDEFNGMNIIVRENGIKSFFNDCLYADIFELSQNFVEYKFKCNSLFQTYVYLQDEGLFRIKNALSLKNHRKEELLYLHMQKRRIIENMEISYTCPYRINRGRFYDIKEKIHFQECFCGFALIKLFFIKIYRIILTHRRTNK